MGGLNSTTVPANVANFLGTYNNFVSAVTGYAKGSSTQSEVVNAANDLVSAATALSQSPTFSAISNATGFVGAINSLSTDLNDYQNGATPGLQFQGFLGVVQDTSTIGAVTVGVLSPLCGPLAKSCETISGGIETIECHSGHHTN